MALINFSCIVTYVYGAGAIYLDYITSSSGIRFFSWSPSAIPTQLQSPVPVLLNYTRPVSLVKV